MAEKIKPKYSDEEKAKILKLAQKRFRKSVTAWSENYTRGLKKLKFFFGEQWLVEEKQRRKDAKRPALVLNQEPKFALQVCGELRKNKVQIKVSPTDSKGTQANANIRAGMIKNMEYLSNAESIYDHGNKMMVISGFGAARVLSRYCDDPKDPFKQELYIEKIDNPFAWHMDPDSKDQFFADAEYAFGDTPMVREDFIDSYGEDALPQDSSGSGEGTQDELWYDPEKVWVREYFFKEYTIKTMCQLSDGQIKEKADAEQYIGGLRATIEAAKADQDQKRAAALAAGQAFDEQPLDDSSVPEIVKERDMEEPHIKWMKITATEILEEEDWPGPLIPVAFLTGEYLNIGGKKYYYGMFENAEDAQKMLNNAYTSLWEIIALMPKAPWKASAKMIEGYEDDYLASNAENFPLLKFKEDPKFPGLTPQQNQPGAMPQAMFGMFQSCKEDMKDVIGMFNANLGDKGRELSGAAINARQVPGDTAMYTYPDNSAGWIAHIGKIINAAMGNKYDSERDVRVRGFNGKDSFVPINTTAGKAAQAIQEDPQKYSGMDKKPLKSMLEKKGAAAPFNNITEGDYDVVISTGPAYQTQRQEAAENILKIAQLAGKTNPADLWHLVSNLDFPGADEWAQTIAKRVPAGVLPIKEGEQPQQPLPPSPQAQVMMGKIQLELEKVKLAKIQQQVAIVKLQNELAQNKDEVSKQILVTLSEMMAPEHPADQVDLGGGGQ